MGKSEILMLLAGVALSIMLAMIAIPMFSSGQDMADRQQVQQELLSIKSAIPLIKGLEGSEYSSGTLSVGKITATNIISHMKGFEASEADSVKGKSGFANFKIEDNDSANKKIVTVTVKTLSNGTHVKLNELSRLDKICDGETFVPATHIDNGVLTCKMLR